VAAAALAVFASVAWPATAAASGLPPSHSHLQTGGPQTLHGGHSTLKQYILNEPRNRGRFTQSGVPLTANTTIYDNTPVVFIRGLMNIGDNNDCTGTGGYWTNAINYLLGVDGTGKAHPGIPSGTNVEENGAMVPLTYYGQQPSTGCADVSKESTNCNGWPTSAWTTTSSVIDTTNMDTQFVSCEIAWYIYDQFSQWGQNVYVVAHSMGGLLIRDAIVEVETGTNKHFPPFLDINDVVTFDSPYAGIGTGLLADGQIFYCGVCNQGLDMVSTTTFIKQLNSIADPQTCNHCTNWTMMGSLSGGDPIDWDYSATHLSTVSGYDLNHRIGYLAVPGGNHTCYYNGSNPPGFTDPNDYVHGDFMTDQCEQYNATYYYCDGCSEDAHTGFSKSTGAPHALHDMIFSFEYTGW
jgi:hypothetical protein